MKISAQRKLQDFTLTEVKGPMNVIRQNVKTLYGKGEISCSNHMTIISGTWLFIKREKSVTWIVLQAHQCYYQKNFQISESLRVTSYRR